MVSMIDTLKRNVVQNQLTPTQQQMGAQAQQQAQGAMPPQQGQPRPNPHLQTIDALQKQKGQLQKQYQNISPVSNMLGNAAESILNAQPGESAMRTLARGFLGASGGLRGAGEQQQENLRQQSEIDRAIANTHQYIEDYQYNKMVEREKLNMEHEKIDISRGEAANKNLNLQRQLMQDMQKQNFEQQKFNHELTKNYQKESEDIVHAYDQSKNLMKSVNEIENLLKNKIKDWSPMTASIASKFGDQTLPVVSGQDLTQWALLKKNLNDLQTQYTQGFGNHNKLTNAIVEMVRSGKIDIGMGRAAMLEALGKIKSNLQTSMKRDEFTLDAMRKGVDKDLAMRGFDAYSEDPKKYKDPYEAMNNIAQGNQFEFAPNYSQGANTEASNQENEKPKRDHEEKEGRSARAREAAKKLFGGQQ